MKKLENLSDEELVEKVRTQDQNLYQEVVVRYQDKLLRYAVYLTNDQDRAADVVQEAFIKAFINLHGFNTKKRFSSWIYRIVHNEAINLIKKNKRTISLEEDQWVAEYAHNDDSLVEELAQKEVREMVNQCLKKLPLIYRSPLSLFYLENRSYEEISDILRMPIGTVGTRINRGKKMLKVIIRNKKHA